MPVDLCPTCQRRTASIADDTAIADVDYYRCNRCGHIWCTPKDGPGVAPRTVMRGRLALKDESMTTSDADERARIRQFFPPLGIIVLCLPLMFRMIPRNALYGIRVREAFQSEADWYAINELGAAALIGACLVWLAAAAYAPRRFVKPIGIVAVLLALGALTLTRGWTL
jgi:hypothetical protein